MSERIEPTLVACGCVTWRGNPDGTATCACGMNTIKVAESAIEPDGVTVFLGPGTPPALSLSAEEWADFQRAPRSSIYDDVVGDDAAEMAGIIALNNAALPDGHPCKITREKVDLLFGAEVTGVDANGNVEPDAEATRKLHNFAYALASYLPPEGT